LLRLGSFSKAEGVKYWLMKSEPKEFSIDALKKNKKTLWTGVRNYQARNYMTQEMRKGDLVVFYHSNAQPSGIAGLAIVSSEEAQVDPLQFDAKSEYYDPKSKKEKPTWYCVEISYKAHAQKFVSLDELKKVSSLKDMKLLQRGNRLSIMPLTEKEFTTLSKLAGFKLAGF
jgi:predicted RNA-binding protein with PUA-like domain